MGALGKKAMSATGKKNAAAMKKKGVGIFAPKKLSDALAAICGGKTMPRTEVTKDLGLHQGELAQPGSHHQAGCEVEGHLPGCEHRHVEDGWVREQALVLRPWGSLGHLAEEFRRRAGLSSRGLLSRARLFLEWLLLLPDFTLKSSVGAFACP